LCKKRATTLHEDRGTSSPHITSDTQGRTVDFKNTLIIMTSNVGSSVIEKGGGGLGFQLDTSEEDSSYNRIKTLVNEELKQYFRPEFLNRWAAAVCMLHEPNIAVGMLPVKPGHCIGIFSGLSACDARGTHLCCDCMFV